MNVFGILMTLFILIVYLFIGLIAILKLSRDKEQNYKKAISIIAALMTAMVILCTYFIIFKN